jgi:hypothetical protein
VCSASLPAMRSVSSSSCTDWVRRTYVDMGESCL